MFLTNLICNIFNLVSKNEFESKVEQVNRLSSQISELENKIGALSLTVEELKKYHSNTEEEAPRIHTLTLKKNNDITYYINDTKIEIEDNEDTKKLEFKEGSKVKIYAQANDPELQNRVALYIDKVE